MPFSKRFLNGREGMKACRSKEAFEELGGPI